MALREEVLEAAGGARWATLRQFTSHLKLDGSLFEPLEDPQALKEIVAQGDVRKRSIRISGFSETREAWGFNPDFITIQREDGAFVGARREAAPRPLMRPRDEAELVYLCGLSIWNCMTTPLVLLQPDTEAEDLGVWTEQGETWRRLKVQTPQSALAYARESVMYFGEDALLRRTDFDVVCGEPLRLVDYASAHHRFSGLTVPTLHRMVRRAALPDAVDPTPLLDIEIFDARFDWQEG